MASAAELLADNLRQKLDGQLAALESTRTRAAVALSVSGVIAGLFGPDLLKSPGNLALAAIASVVLSAVPAIYVLLPHKLTLWPAGEGWRDWVKKYDEWMEEGAQVDNSKALLQSQMIDDMARWYTGNKPVLDHVQLALAVAFAGVILELVLWALAAFA